MRGPAIAYSAAVAVVVLRLAGIAWAKGRNHHHHPHRGVIGVPMILLGVLQGGCASFVLANLSAMQEHAEANLAQAKAGQRTVEEAAKRGDTEAAAIGAGDALNALREAEEALRSSQRGGGPLEGDAIRRRIRDL